jgi:hypothetical protein
MEKIIRGNTERYGEEGRSRGMEKERKTNYINLQVLFHKLRKITSSPLTELDGLLRICILIKILIVLIISGSVYIDYSLLL